MNDFTVEDLIGCYQSGVFPMAETRRDEHFYLVDPPDRGVLPLDAFHIPRRLARSVRADRFKVRVDSAFAAVLGHCAAPAPGREESWISGPIKQLYQELFRRGMAHSVECWLDDELAGGLYGVAIGGAFFGESMFSLQRDASKIALVHLVARLRAGGYALLDTQFLTEHLEQFGTCEISRAEYRLRLKRALALRGDFFRLPAYAPGDAILQAINHAS